MPSVLVTATPLRRRQLHATMAAWLVEYLSDIKNDRSFHFSADFCLFVALGSSFWGARGPIWVQIGTLLRFGLCCSCTHFKRTMVRLDPFGVVGACGGPWGVRGVPRGPFSNAPWEGGPEHLQGFSILMPRRSPGCQMSHAHCTSLGVFIVTRIVPALVFALICVGPAR